MKLLHNIIVSTFLFTAASSAYATLIDFKANANNEQGIDALLAPTSNLGEKGYSSLIYSDPSFGSLTITGSATNDTKLVDGVTVADDVQFAYMDSRSGASVANGGLGVCKDINSRSQCTPSSDDNVTNAESLHMIWDTNVLITGIWFNNNHDSDFSLVNINTEVGDTIKIGGLDYQFALDDFYAERSSGDTLALAVGNRNADFLYDIDRYVSADSSFDISFVNDQFYISAIEFETVPEPGMLALLSIGLIGLVAIRRRI